MNPITFHIPIVPPKSTSQGKRLAMVNGKAMFFKKKSHQEAENDITLLMSRYAPDEPMRGPVAVAIELTWPWRASESKRSRDAGRRPHTSPPDCDNAAKMICDVLQKLRFFENDSQVASLIVRKFWGDKVGISVNVNPILEELHPGWLEKIERKHPELFTQNNFK